MLTMFKSSDDIVKEIHNEIDTAQDRLLANAMAIIGHASSTEEKASRLRNAGFINSPLAKKHSAVQMTRNEAELIEMYKREYPTLKFLTEAELDRICRKYNLIYAPIGKYVKDVPDHALSDIEKAPEVKYDHRISHRTIIRLTDPRYLISGKEHKRSLINGVTLEGDRGVASAYRKLREIYPNVETTYQFADWEVRHQDLQGLFIAAPSSHFDTAGLKKNGLGFFNITEVKDPIVFRYVKGGVQVLAKWGIEAEDSALSI